MSIVATSICDVCFFAESGQRLRFVVPVFDSLSGQEPALNVVNFEQTRIGVGEILDA
jgi:hypothetical protein